MSDKVTHVSFRHYYQYWFFGLRRLRRHLIYMSVGGCLWAYATSWIFSFVFGFKAGLFDPEMLTSVVFICAVMFIWWRLLIIAYCYEVLGFELLGVD